jgi:hypothetical protein
VGFSCLYRVNLPAQRVGTIVRPFNVLQLIIWAAAKATKVIIAVNYYGRHKMSPKKVFVGNTSLPLALAVYDYTRSATFSKTCVPILERQHKLDSLHDHSRLMGEKSKDGAGHCSQLLNMQVYSVLVLYMSDC